MYLTSEVTAPATEPLSIEEARLHLRVEVSLEDPLIAAFITAARLWAEGFTGRAFVTQTHDLLLDRFPCSREQAIPIPLPPLQAVSSVKYYDTGGTQQTLAGSSYIVTAPAGPYADPGSVRLAYGVEWPETQERPNAVEVRFVCGYGAATVVPELIKAGMRLQLGEFFKNREDTVASDVRAAPQRARDVLRPFRLMTIS